jgi:hypothetical protein
MFRPGRIDCKIEITYCTRNQLSQLFYLFFAKKVDEESINSSIQISPAQFLNIMTKCSEEKVLEFLTSTQSSSSISSSDDLVLSSLVESDNPQSKRRRRSRKSSKPKTKLELLAAKQKTLTRMNKLIQTCINKSNRIRESLVTQGEKIRDELQKTTERSTMSSKQTFGVYPSFNVVQTSENTIRLKRKRE